MCMYISSYDVHKYGPFCVLNTVLEQYTLIIYCTLKYIVGGNVYHAVLYFSIYDDLGQRASITAAQYSTWVRALILSKAIAHHACRLSPFW